MTKPNRTLQIATQKRDMTAELAIIEAGSPLASIKFTAEQLHEHIKVAINALEILSGGKKATASILMPGDPGFKVN